MSDINKPKVIDLINFLDSYKLEDYQQYLKDFAPVFSPFIYQTLTEQFNFYEKNSHSDVSKYLEKPLLDYSENFGKLHRPLTCIAAYLACTCGNTQDIQNVFVVASAIELFQTAALIHDDIADDGQMRRGVPCLHKTIGEALAINAGDYGLSATLGSVINALKNSNLSASKILDIADQLIFMEYMTIEGQAMDLGWAKDNRFDISQDDYFCMATKKSAYYSAEVPCVLAAICADAGADVIAAFKTFGQKIGLAFQIQDDLLNLDYKNYSQKDTLSDITEGKKTLCFVKALDFASKSDAEKLIEIFKSKTNDRTKLIEAVCIMEDCGAIEYAKNLANDLSSQAYDALLEVLPNSNWKLILLDMAKWSANRQS